MLKNVDLYDKMLSYIKYSILFYRGGFKMIKEILANYASMLNITMWKQAFSDSSAIGLVVSLALLECLLSTDNALVLSTLVKRLPKKQQKKALFYGLWGAYIFRFLLIGIGVYLIHFWIIKAIGAIYLASLSIKFFKERYINNETDEEINDEPKASKKLSKIFGMFWSTVIEVELMDLVFSVDSVLASLAVSDKIWIVLLGGLIGILCMRGIATLIIGLMEKVPELETTAYVLILFIAFKMILSVFKYEISTNVFLIFVVSCFILTFLIHYIRSKSKNKQ